MRTWESLPFHALSADAWRARPKLKLTFQGFGMSVIWKKQWTMLSTTGPGMRHNLVRLSLLCHLVSWFYVCNSLESQRTISNLLKRKILEIKSPFKRSQKEDSRNSSIPFRDLTEYSECIADSHYNILVPPFGMAFGFVPSTGMIICL